uniref:Uncharacterized protein n=1 Tax=Leptospira santarosai serovar Arenal str. MAVJ 401 TaxID=1049976 RepID=M6JYN2_9LEPT|nr:hypothetical protein LEP1GSC063_2980 [Leptospira santarosai serovar Arenal str. MAVJ 401]
MIFLQIFISSISRFRSRFHSRTYKNNNTNCLKKYLRGKIERPKEIKQSKSIKS